MMNLRILYIAPENNAGTLDIWQKAHRELGNEARYVTLFPSESDFPDDIALDLPLTPDAPWLQAIKKVAYRAHGQAGIYKEAEGYPPTWQPKSIFEYWFFSLREKLWEPRIREAIDRYDLDEYDIYHLESGLGLFRDGRIMEELKSRGKHLICNYHGTDLRTRGVIPAIDHLADVNITSELDLLDKHPAMEYLFLPFETEKFEANTELHSPIRLCHATRNRYFKGSDRIIEVCRRLEQERSDTEFVLIENRPHDETLQLKASSDVYIDQISNTGGWGYGMNSVEALSMGLCCCTNLIPRYEEFIPDHPFVNIAGETLYHNLDTLLDDPDRIRTHARRGKMWVETYHDIRNVIRSVYEIYHREGWIETLPWEE